MDMDDRAVHLPAGTFDFPLVCDNNHVAGYRGDGSPFTFPVSKIRDLVPLLRDIKTLCVHPNLRDVHIFERILDIPMPRLERLRIDTFLWANQGPQERFPPPPTYIMRAANFPRLHTLMVQDTFVNMEAPLCSSLRFLHLELSERGERQFPLERFLHALRNSPNMVHLYVENYIDIAAAARNPPPPVLQLASHKRLKYITVRDLPHVVPKILSHLIIPPHVDVVVTADAGSGDPHSAFRAMLPTDPQKLGILQRAAGLALRHEGTHVSVFGRDTHNAHGTLNIELLLGRSDMLPDRGSTLLDTMVQSVDIYAGSPVRTIEIEGDLRPVSEASWASMFDSFPDVEVLDLTDFDTQPGPSDVQRSLRALFQALVAPSGVHPGVVCQHLRHLKLSLNLGGQASIGVLMGLVHACFMRRSLKLGAPRLSGLTLSLCVDRAWDAGLETQCRLRLAAVAHFVDIELHARSD